MSYQYQSSSTAGTLRAATVFAGLVTMAACGMLNSNGSSQNPNGTAQNGNSVQNGNSTGATQAAQLAGAALEVTSQDTNTYINKCQQTPACQQLATEVGQTVGQTVQDMKANKDCSQDLTTFVNQLQQLVTCMDGNSTGVTPPTTPVTATGNSNDCNNTMDGNGNSVSTCNTGSCTCVTRHNNNGTVTETCTGQGSSTGNTGNGNNPTVGNPNSGDPNGTSVGDGNSTTVSNPVTNPNPVGNPNETGVVANPNTASNPNYVPPVTGAESCSTQTLANGATSVTCTCSTVTGSCSGQMSMTE